MPIDTIYLRDKVKELRESEDKRFSEDPQLVNKAVAWYKIWVQNKQNLDSTRKAKNDMNKQIGALKKKKENADNLIIESKALSAEILVQQDIVSFMETQMKSAVDKLGNIIHPSVPVSKNEDDNVIENTFSCDKKYDVSELKFHHQLLYRIGGFEPERGVKVAGRTFLLPISF